ncbi:nucleoside phosphorylase [Paracrocinitomix mangrovi]|uniref:nucleoside phosphorylase n=1 Tax=Paracrocinitomix mangrovi TaxID=2862509 RepID=UPI001C8D9BAF|nr:nucleoside phosphorylase [Paracrocinitomix mangrovi]UKN02873.1 nucleoside phosphorylase [Paracrocinitomix mangrovi]
MAFEASELTLDKNGKIYHLGIGPGDIAETIILVGDQNRVDLVGTFFEKITFKNQNREFSTITGTYKGKPMSVVSTGIGTDNVDIVLNEIDAVVNIDLENRKEKDEKVSLDFIRIGTCGALQEDIDPGTYIISKYAIGLDGVANFYEVPYTDDEKSAMDAFIKHSKWGDKLNYPYIKRGSDRLREQLKEGMEEGITTTANGFYGPQGRAIRIPLSIPDFKENIRTFVWDDTRATNLEMETSALYALSDALGHSAITCCLALANRYSNKFMPDYKDQMMELIETVLERLHH